ncbi:hypothetical protein ABZ354_06225 [Streptomyces sp. NPDC005925]|uniref:hypothetical protein n=1 Tax=Streptomyces sp. NPDC005925 TaxID=3157172 RepID=UPI0033F2B1C8
MGSLKVTFCTGLLAAAALTPAASPAYAASPALVSPALANDDASGLTVTPRSPEPGSDVRLRVADCAERTAIVVSTVFVADVRLTASEGGLTGESRIRSTVGAGTYDVRVACGGSGRIGTITVGKARERQPRQQPDPVRPPKPEKPPQPEKPPAPEKPPGLDKPPKPEEPAKTEQPAKSAAPAHPDPARPVRSGVPASPVAPVEAGGGGTARLAAAKSHEDRTGPGTVHVVTGLVLASVAAGAVALGGVRRRSRRPD